MQHLRAEITVAKDTIKDRCIISMARVITDAEALEAMQKADANKQGSAKTTARTRPSSSLHRPQLHFTPISTHSTIHITPFTHCVYFNLSRPRSLSPSLPRPWRLSQKQPQWNTSSDDKSGSSSYTSDIEETSTAWPSTAGDLHTISERLHQMNLCTDKQWHSSTSYFFFSIVFYFSIYFSSLLLNDSVCTSFGLLVHWHSWLLFEIIVFSHIAIAQILRTDCVSFPHDVSYPSWVR